MKDYWETVLTKALRVLENRVCSFAAAQDDVKCVPSEEIDGSQEPQR
jgi:hypothetical protein